MAVLVLGGYGLIGSAVVDRLQDENISAIGLGRRIGDARRRRPNVEWREADLARLRAPEDWLPLLSGVDTVVNAAGVLQQGLSDDVPAVQLRAMVALYQAAPRAGVRRFVQISAVGASPDAATPFLRTKAQADASLRRSGLDHVIIRPGLVISPVAYGGTALLRGLAAFPAVTPLVSPESPVQTVCVGDVAEAVIRAITGQIPAGAEFDLVERQSRSLADTVALFREWLGAAPARQLGLPDWFGRIVSVGADALGWLGWRSPLRSTALATMRAGVTGDADAGVAQLGREPRTLPQMLTRLPSTPQERWFARMWLARAMIIATLSAFWTASGVIGLARLPAAVDVLTARGSPADFAMAAALFGGVIDVALGLLILFRPLTSAALKGIIAVCLAYAAGAALLAPDLWLDPLGPMVKVAPALMLAVVGLAVVEER